jgi:hypothetical protein
MKKNKYILTTESLTKISIDSGFISTIFFLTEYKHIRKDFKVQILQFSSKEFSGDRVCTYL